MSDSPLLIAGLGNPGEKYARHRHNVGFMAADSIAERYRFGPFRPRYHGAVSEGALGGRKTLILKPMTYMNESGYAVGAAMREVRQDKTRATLAEQATIWVKPLVTLAGGIINGGTDADVETIMAAN